MANLMENATDFSWQEAKAAHAVLLCDMEMGALQWDHTDRIDRIHRAHGEKHVRLTHSKIIGKNRSGGRKPWFYKPFQSGSCSQKKCVGKQLGHAEKDCCSKKKKNHTKIE